MKAKTLAPEDMPPQPLFQNYAHSNEGNSNGDGLPSGKNDRNTMSDKDVLPQLSNAKHVNSQPAFGDQSFNVPRNNQVNGLSLINKSSIELETKRISPETDSPDKLIPLQQKTFKSNTSERSNRQQPKQLCGRQPTRTSEKVLDDLPIAVKLPLSEQKNSKTPIGS